MTSDQVYEKLGMEKLLPHEVQRACRFIPQNVQEFWRQSGRTTKMLVYVVSLLSQKYPVCVVAVWPEGAIKIQATLRDYARRCGVDTLKLSVIHLAQHKQTRSWGGYVLVDHACAEVESMRDAYERVQERARYNLLSRT